MQRYFTDKKNNNIFTLNEDDTYHITKVMRMNINDKIEVIYDNKLYISKIININDVIEAEIIEEKEDNNELSQEIILVQSLVKEQKMDYILQKNTELGVSKIIPYLSSRSIIKLKPNDYNKKVDRWNKITKEASEQSKRNSIPVVTNPIDLNELIKIDADIKILCTVNEKSKSLKNVLQNSKKCDRIIIVVGPEGGFTTDEETKLIDNGYISTSLGTSVLRTETASIFVVSSIRYNNMR